MDSTSLTIEKVYTLVGLWKLNICIYTQVGVTKGKTVCTNGTTRNKTRRVRRIDNYIFMLQQWKVEHTLLGLRFRISAHGNGGAIQVMKVNTHKWSYSLQV